MKVPSILIEAISRFAKGKPKFFALIQNLSIAIAAVSFAIGLVKEMEPDLPSWLAWIDSAAIKVGAITAIIMAQLPNVSPNDTADKNNSTK